MFQILYVSLKNFRGNKEVRLTFPNDKVTIIHGTNGSGKTTLLKVIHAMFNMNDSIIANEKITEGLLILLEKETEQKKFVSVKFVEDENIYVWETDIDDYEDFTEDFSSLVFGVNRGITFNNAINKVSPVDVHRMFREFNLNFDESTRYSSSSARVIEDVTDFLNQQVVFRTRRMNRNRLDIDLHEKHLMLDSLSMINVEAMLNRKYIIEKKYMSERVQNALFDTLAQVVDNENKDVEEVPEDFVEKLSKYRDTLIELLSDLEGNELSKKIVHALSNYEDINNPFEKKGLITHLVYNMITELEKGRGIFNTVTQLIDEFNDYLEEEKKLVIDENGTRVVTKSNKHGIEKLSSGERHLLSFLTLFVIEGSKRDILMIDEPEISLNLEWQSKLLNMLSKFAPNSQIIVATHSPAIAEYNTNNLVEIK
ncbi:AAA family ATPase [Lederbergia citrea]|uniref:AAA family ATPase n=1 Tax=Lederbergia citrea TaxID=2833581 RepID=UPI001BC9EDB4|nr:AAA family ATPase [Lederbergia citrea]MBS4206307.1 AAA family ATPase [Lederbergia citrea]